VQRSGTDSGWNPASARVLREQEGVLRRRRLNLQDA
jgi:hypothetical protein